MKYPTLAKVAAVLITVALLAILLSQVDLADVVTTLVSINPIYLVAGFFLYTCSYIFRALRFHVLLNREVGLRALFQIVCVHNMVNGILPARTGELSYIYLLKKITGRTTGEGIATLVVARVFDCIAISILFLSSLSIVGDLPDFIRDCLLVVIFAMVVMIISLMGLLYSGRSFLRIMNPLFQVAVIKKLGISDFLLRKGEETVEALDSVAISKNFCMVLISSLLIWILNYVVAYVLILGMDIIISPQSVILGGTFILLTMILPIQGIGGFGTTEGIWTLVFVPLGMSLSSAVVSGFGYHIILIGYYFLLGVYGLLKLNIYPNLTSLQRRLYL